MITTMVRRVLRRVSAPFRNYFNEHFEATKHEIRTNAGQHAPAADAVATGGTGLESLANSVAEVGIHQGRLLAATRNEVADLADQIGSLELAVLELRASVDRIIAIQAAELDRPASDHARPT